MKHNKRWEKVLWIILFLTITILAFLVVVQCSKIIRERTEQEEPEETQESTEAYTEEESTTEETESEAETETETEIIETKNVGYIIIGDSHIVVTDGQGYSVQGSSVEGIIPNQNLFFVHTSLDPVMGTFEWLEGDGTDRIKELISGHSEISHWNIISMHGTSMVTMPNIIDKYIANYKKWMEETFLGCDIYIVSVPPLDEKEWVVRHPELPARSNQDIITFNKAIEQAFPECYFNYYDWFLAHDSFQDEIHYTGATYREMFDEIIGKIQQ